jgi:hypothetical protein
MVCPPTPEYTVDTEEDPLFDSIFAMTASMADIDRMRSKIRALWISCNTGEANLASVSVATNTAIQLAKSYEDEIKPFFIKKAGNFAIPRPVFYRYVHNPKFRPRSQTTIQR